MIKTKTCKVCGKIIPVGVKYRLYCSDSCKREGELENKRKYYHANREYLALKRRIKRQIVHGVTGKYAVGMDALAAAVVVEAIHDIKECSLKEIERYEDAAWRHKRKNILPRKCKNYLTAKAFLLSDRFDAYYITRLRGKEIFEILMKEKGDS